MMDLVLKSYLRYHLGESSEDEDDQNDQITITYLQRDYTFDKKLYDFIQDLPTVLRHKLYIYCMRQFWKDDLARSLQVPVWIPRSVQQQQLLFEARHKNIHFLHLPCNTRPEYKKYIIGCQCEYCKYCAHPIDKQRELRKNSESFLYFYKTVPTTDSLWNDRMEIIRYDEDGDHMYGLPVFNSFFEDYSLSKKLQYTKFTFSEFPANVSENE